MTENYVFSESQGFDTVEGFSKYLLNYAFQQKSISIV